MNKKVINILTKKMQSLVLCIFLLFTLSFCISCKKQKKISETNLIIQINPLSKFNDSDMFKINKTVIIHTENFYSKFSNKDTIWLPASKIIIDQHKEKKFFQPINNTGILSVLAEKLHENKIVKLNDDFKQTSFIFDYFKILQKTEIRVSDEYFSKIIIKRDE